MFFLSGIEIAVPLEGLVDFDKERERLKATLTKLSGEYEGLQKRLSNQDFVARAAAEVVAQSQVRSAELEEQIAKMKVVMENL